MSINTDIKTLLSYRFSCANTGCSNCVLHTDEEFKGSMCIVNILLGQFFYPPELNKSCLSPQQFLLELEFCMDVNISPNSTCNNNAKYCDDCKMRDFGCISGFEKFLCKHLKYWRKI